jgi:hypothetical protein
MNYDTWRSEQAKRIAELSDEALKIEIAEILGFTWWTKNGRAAVLVKPDRRPAEAGCKFVEGVHAPISEKLFWMDSTRCEWTDTDYASQCLVSEYIAANSYSDGYVCHFLNKVIGGDANFKTVEEWSTMFTSGKMGPITTRHLYGLTMSTPRDRAEAVLITLLAVKEFGSPTG